MTVTHPEHSTLAAKVAALFHAHPGAWIDGRTVMAVAGAYGWRTRISDVRRAPYHMRVVNRQRTIRKTDGGRFVVSEYRYEPEERDRSSVSTEVGAAGDAPTSPAAV